MDLNLLLTAGIAVGGFSFAGIAMFNQTRCRRKIRQLESQLNAATAEIDQLSTFKKEAESRTADHARKIAWLETRIRKPERSREIDDEGTFYAAPASPSTMTERRHRVMTLARRGYDANSIATSLGMLIGEVELIMSLGRGTKQFA